jgi:D-alanyl-D-alanine dipeptidase
MDTQELYFPLIKNKEDLLSEDYLSRRCPHSRGGSADVSIIKKGKQVISPKDMQAKTIKLENSERTIQFLDDGTEFMGTHFDFFDVSSHWDTDLITEEAKKNREFLLKVMNECGFRYF